MPPGSPRYYSWLFAAPPSRQPLLGMYALLAEWRALLDPSTESHVAQVKLPWWQEEIRRLRDGRPSHPISRFLHALPHAASCDLSPLSAAVDAALEFVAGAPVEHAAELDGFAAALLGTPLSLVSDLNGSAAMHAVRGCTNALGSADYLARAAHDYRREARLGRVSLPVDELLEAGVENADLLAEAASPRLERYLQTILETATLRFAAASALLPHELLAGERHLVVLAHAERRQLEARTRAPGPWHHVTNLYAAWNTARRAAAAR